MIIAVDDSGDPGFDFKHGSSKYFAIAGVALKDADSANIARKRVDEIRKSLHWKEMHEFKANKIEAYAHDIFMKSISDIDMQSLVLIRDKEKIEETSSKYLYNETIAMVIKDLYDEKDNMILIIDGESKAKDRKEASRIFRSFLSKGVIKKIKYCDSRKENLIQIADMIGGTSYPGYRNADNIHYKRMVSSGKIRIELK